MSEIQNGGYSVKIGGYTLNLLGSYSPSWTNEYDENSFKDWQGNFQKILKGRRFSLKISVNRMPVEDFRALSAELKKQDIAVECPDFTGICYCDDIPGELKQANFLAVRYGISFTLTAKELLKSGNGL